MFSSVIGSVPYALASARALAGSFNAAIAPVFSQVDIVFRLTSYPYSRSRSAMPSRVSPICTRWSLIKLPNCRLPDVFGAGILVNLQNLWCISRGHTKVSDTRDYVPPIGALRETELSIVTGWKEGWKVVKKSLFFLVGSNKFSRQVLYSEPKMKRSRAVASSQEHEPTGVSCD